MGAVSAVKGISIEPAAQTAHKERKEGSIQKIFYLEVGLEC